MDDNNSNNNSNINENAPEAEHPEKPSLGSRISSGLSKASDIINQYQDGGLSSVVKNAASKKIGEKVDKVKDNVKNKANDKINNIKNNAKDKINSKIPDSVKQKKQALNNKANNVKNKLNAPKRKSDELKNKLNAVRENTNKKVFKSAVKSAVNMAAPGAGVAAEKILETPIGKPAMDAAAKASNPISAIKEGTKKLLKIVLSKEVKKKIIAIMLPTLTAIFLIVIVVLGIMSKFTDSQTFAKGNVEGAGKGSAEELDEKYKAFYENVEKYSQKYGTGQAMIIAALTSYKDNDVYSDMTKESEDTSEDEDDDNDETIIDEYSKSAMKKYIKKVAKKLKESNNDITQGDYKDRNTGSIFFWWLYDDFVDDYYKDYVGKDSKNHEKKKKEIIDFIYLYYKDIADMDENILNCKNSYYNATCPSVTVTGGKGAGTYNLEEYITAVVAQEMGYSGSKGEYMEAKKAQAIAARTYLLSVTNNCKNSIENSTNAQTVDFEKAKNDKEAQEAANATAGIVLLDQNNDIFTSQYSSISPTSTCSNGICKATFQTQPNKTNKVQDIEQTWLTTKGFSLKGGHKYGMSQYGAMYLSEKGYKYDEILKYYYEGSKISATSTTTGETTTDHKDSGEKVRITMYEDDSLGAGGLNKDSKEISTDSKGWRYYTDPSSGQKYLVVATSTEECLKSNSCASSESRHDGMKYYKYYDKLVVKIDGVEYNSIVLDSCGACMKAPSDRGDTTNMRIDVWRSKNGTSYKNDYGEYYDDGSVASSNNGAICGYSGNGLVSVDGFEQRVSRAPRTNSYYYNQETNTAANGWLEGECAWYASARAQEILATLNNGATWNYNGNGNTYCRSSDAKKFVNSTDSKKPQQGAIVSWSSGKYGHVAIVENVEGDTVTISEAGLSFGSKASYGCSTGECVRKKLKNGAEGRRSYCELNNTGCFNTRKVSIERMKKLEGSFNCYIYLAQPIK